MYVYNLHIMIGICILCIFLTSVSGTSTLFLLDIDSALNTKYRRLFPTSDDQVLVGEYLYANNQSMAFYRDLSDAGDINMTYAEQLHSGVNALRAIYPREDAIVVNAHHGNNGFQSYGSKRASYQKIGDFTAVLKYGMRDVEKSLTSTISHVFADYLNEILNNTGGTECSEVTESLPAGKQWSNTGTSANIRTCECNWNKCNIKASEDQMQQAANWADNAIAKYPDSIDYKMGFSNNEAWHLCIKLVRNELCDDKYDAYDAVTSMGCPQGYCNGTATDCKKFADYFNISSSWVYITITALSLVLLFLRNRQF